MIIVSLASYDKRLDFLQKTIFSILNQTLRYDLLIINIPDDSDKETIEKFKEFERLDTRIQVNLRDGRWRSANKLLWTAKDHPDDVIITCDDDIFYPAYFFEELYSEWLKHKDCIIAQETSPVFIQDSNVLHISSIDVKLKQKCFGRYLTGCCLFPPHVLDGTDAYNFKLFFDITHATHDELWFWCMTTIKGIHSIGLNLTYSFDADEVVLPRDEHSLSRINSDPYLKEYNLRINEVFGNKLVEILKSQVVEFHVSPDNILGVCLQMSNIYNIYGKYYNIKFICNRILKSHLKFLSKYMDNIKWQNKIEIKLND